MNDKTIQLLETLAAKLGTTAEYLWGVLIKQAAVSATTNVFLVLITWAAVGLYIKWLSNKLKDEDFDWDCDFGTGVMIITGGILSCVFFAVSVFKGIPEIITGYLNPEYWAFQKILESI